MEIIKSLVALVLYGYEIFIALFSLSYVVFYFILAILSYIAIAKHVHNKKLLEDDIVTRSNYMPGVSVVAPAFNEGVNIVYIWKLSKIVTENAQPLLLRNFL